MGHLTCGLLIPLTSNTIALIQLISGRNLSRPSNQKLHFTIVIGFEMPSHQKSATGAQLNLNHENYIIGLKICSRNWHLHRVRIGSPGIRTRL